MGQFDRFTEEAKKSLIMAEHEAKEEGVGYIGTEHILIGILHQENTLGYAVLSSLGVSLKNVRLVIQQSSQNRLPDGSQKFARVELSDFAKKAIEDAVSAAYRHRHSFVGTEHLLMGLMQQKGTAATVILENMKINPEDVTRKIEEIFAQTQQQNQGGMQNMMQPLEKMFASLNGVIFAMSQNPEFKDAFRHKEHEHQEQQQQSKTPALDYFTIDLTQEARDGKLEPVIGREKEVERMVHILNRKTKNNPVLIGEPGVGKTAIVEALAQKIVKEEVPQTLLDKRVLAIDMASLVAGTKYRGEFEARIKQVVDEAMQSDNEIILFVDELHTLIGAGSAEGSLDAANILKPALGRGKIQMIGATTTKEYRKYVEKDAALERRLQPIAVEEPAEDDAIAILMGLRKHFEEYHNLAVTDAAVAAAVRLSKRYVNDRFLPDKAIDILDEAMAKKAVGSESGDIKQLKKLKEKLAALVRDKEQAVAKQDYAAAGKIREQELTVTEKIKDFKTRKNFPRELRPVLDERDIAATVAATTGIPVEKMAEADAASLLELEKTLGASIIGQDEAIASISRSIRRSRAGIANPNRPIGSFLFLGPTGVGKTSLVKVLAKEVFGREDALVKIDMSEFMERHNVSRLVGATPGYVGYEEGGQLTELVRKKPYSVVLFDEIEKAHTEAFNILLQILEDGYLTDGKGKRVDFRNTIVVMTSNLGSEEFTAKAATIGFNLTDSQLEAQERDFDRTKDAVLERLQKSFRPELVNRIDSIVVFRPLNRTDIEAIVRLEVAQLAERLSVKQVSLDVSKKAVEWLALKSYKPEFGAREVRRTVQTRLEDPVTELLLRGEKAEGSSIKVKVAKDELLVG